MRGPVLLLGARGMLGRSWQRRLERENIPFTALDLPEFDITNPEHVSRTVTDKFPVVVNCAAYTDVDGAEQNETLALAVNATGVARVGLRCRETGATLVHYSTDFVFDGRACAPYQPDAVTNPLSVYGRTKLFGEAAAAASGCRFLILRTSWLYAPWCRNFVAAIAEAARTKPVLRVVTDQAGRPTSAEHLADVSLRMLGCRATGLWHVTDGGECTRFEMARHIVERVNPACQVEPCLTADFPRPAARPAYSVLDISRTEKLLGPMPPWRGNLDDVLGRLGQP